MEMLKDIRDCMPPEALKVAVKLLPKPLWNRISEMVKLQDFPVEQEKNLIVIPRLPQGVKAKKVPVPSLSKEEQEFSEWSTSPSLKKLIKLGNEQTDSHLPLWAGLKLKLQHELQDAGRFYQEAISEIGEAIGIAEGEPFWNGFLNRWHIAVNFACGSKSVACDWVAIA
jgi:hypothetical protein